MGSIPLKNRDTNSAIVYQQRYQQIERIPTETGKRPRTEKSSSSLLLLTKLNVGERWLVPLAGIEPALLAELDFESSASTSSATGAFA
jgi:site-specific DNA recombinase